MKVPDLRRTTVPPAPAVSDDRQLRAAWRAMVAAQLAVLERDCHAGFPVPAAQPASTADVPACCYPSSSAAMPSTAGKAWI